MSAILAALRLSGRTWCYADLAADAGASVAPGDAVFVHAVIHGSVRVACASGARADLGAGAVIAVPSGEAHALRTAPAAPTTPFDVLRASRDTDVPGTALFGSGSTVARVLSGRLAVNWPAEASRGALPALLRLDPANRAGVALVQPDAMAHAGIGAGAAALLSRLAETLFVATLRSDPSCRGFFARELADPIGEALHLIAGAPSHPWTVESLARAVGMGRSNFAAQFTQRLGKTPMEIVTDHRMDQAAGLLRSGRLKLSEIAELAGYGSDAAFSRRFTRHFGITPSRHRELALLEQQPSPTPTAGFRRLLGAGPAVLPGPEPHPEPRAPSLPSGRRRGILLREPRG
jgi:AraC-like DNA-binding protein